MDSTAATSTPRREDDSPASPPGLLDGWATPGRFAILLAVLIAALFPDVLLGAKSFVFRDFGIFTYPNAYFQRESFWCGEFPLWNPLSDCGIPFLAQWNSICLYPLSLIYLALPLTWGLGLFLLFHLFLAGLGMYALAAQWTQNRFAGAVAGIAFAFGGMTLDCLMWTSTLAAVAWMPWVILAVDRAWRACGVRRVTIAVLAAGMQILTGTPEIIIFTWMILGALGAGALICDRRRRARIVPVTAAVVAGAAMLCAAQLLPFFDLLSHSERSSAFGSNLWSMPVWGWADLFVPLFHCYRAPLGVYFQPAQDWTSSYYLGLPVLALAAAAPFLARRLQVAILAALGLFGILAAMGDGGHVYSWVLKGFPPLGFMRYPIKFVMLTVFSVPLLAAYGVARLLRAAPAGADRAGRAGFAAVIAPVFAVCAAIAAGILGHAHAHPLPYEQWPVIFANGLERLAALALALAALWCLTRAPAPRRQFIGACLLLFVVWLDLASHAPRQNPTVDPATFAPGLMARRMVPPPRLGEARAFMNLQTHNVVFGSMLPDADQDYLGRRGALLGDCNLLDDIPIADGFYPLYVREQRSLFEQFFLAPTNAFPGGFADFLGISQASDPDQVLAWKPRASHLPFYSVGPRPVFVELSNTPPLLLAADFDPRRVVYLPPEARSMLAQTHAVGGAVRRAHFGARTVELEVDASAPTLLVLSQTWYHPWRAYVNAAPVSILRADYAFQAVPIPQGASTVKLVYEDRWFYGGLFLSLAALLACLGGWFYGNRRPARPAEAH